MIEAKLKFLFSAFAQFLQDPLLAILQPPPLPNNLVAIQGPVLVEASAIQNALLGGFPAPVQILTDGIPVIEEKIVRTNPYFPYSANVPKIAITQAPRRVVQYLQDDLNDETVRLMKKFNFLISTQFQGTTSTSV